MKNKARLIADLILAAALGLCMAYSLTGGLIHEILGTLMLAGLLVHLIRRRKYYRKAYRAMKAGRMKSFRTKLSFIINIAMIVITAVMLVTSVAISKELFFFLNSAISGYEVWRMAHVLSAVLLVICVFVHICLHAKIYVSVVRELSGGNRKAVTVWNFASRIFALVAAVLVLGVSIDNVAGAIRVYADDRKYYAQTADVQKQITGEIAVSGNTESMTAEEETGAADTNVEELPDTAAEVTTDIQPETLYEEPSAEEEITDPEELYTEEEAEPDETDVYADEEPYSEEEIVIESDDSSEEGYYGYGDEDTEEDYYEYNDEDTDEDYYYDEYEEEPEPVISLSEYLGNLNCSGCGKHCSLLAPQCGRGRNQAENATAEYYAVYGG